MVGRDNRSKTLGFGQRQPNYNAALPQSSGMIESLASAGTDFVGLKDRRSRLGNRAVRLGGGSTRVHPMAPSGGMLGALAPQPSIWPRNEGDFLRAVQGLTASRPDGSPGASVYRNADGNLVLKGAPGPRNVADALAGGGKTVPTSMMEGLAPQQADAPMTMMDALANLDRQSKAMNYRSRRDRKKATTRANVTANARSRALARKGRMAGLGPLQSQLMGSPDGMLLGLLGPEGAARVLQSRNALQAAQAGNVGMADLRAAQAEGLRDDIRRRNDPRNQGIATALQMIGSGNPDAAEQGMTMLQGLTSGMGGGSAGPQSALDGLAAVADATIDEETGRVANLETIVNDAIAEGVTPEQFEQLMRERGVSKAQLEEYFAAQSPSVLDRLVAGVPGYRAFRDMFPIGTQDRMRTDRYNKKVSLGKALGMATGQPYER